MEENRITDEIMRAYHKSAPIHEMGVKKKILSLTGSLQETLCQIEERDYKCIKVYSRRMHGCINICAEKST